MANAKTIDPVDDLKKALGMLIEMSTHGFEDFGYEPEREKVVSRVATFKCETLEEAASARAKLIGIGADAWGKELRVVVGPQVMQPVIEILAEHNGWAIKWIDSITK